MVERDDDRLGAGARATMYSILEFARTLVRPVLGTGDTAVDATVGNGHDTVFLAEMVGPSGRVIGFDIQPPALQATRVMLHESGLASRVELVAAGHQHMRLHLTRAGAIPVQAVMFNLGYLPGGEKVIVTRPVTTIDALEQALQVLAPEGIITVVLYQGHAGAAEEVEAVLGWARGLDPKAYEVVRYQHLNTINPPPFLVAVQKRVDPTVRTSIR